MNKLPNPKLFLNKDEEEGVNDMPQYVKIMHEKIKQDLNEMRHPDIHLDMEMYKDAQREFNHKYIKEEQGIHFNYNPQDFNIPKNNLQILEEAVKQLHVQQPKRVIKEPPPLLPLKEPLPPKEKKRRNGDFKKIEIGGLIEV